jgi:hypothetical protein
MKQINDKEKTNNNNQKSKTPAGFGKGVNDYYNNNISLTDAKAGAILAVNFILLGGLINIDICHCSAISCYLSAISTFISIFFCVIVIYPRLPKAEKGLIFWENLKSYNSIYDYLNDIRQLDISKVEEEYAKQNWYVSKILSLKNYYTRIAIVSFCISLILLVITYLINLLNNL